MPIQSPCRSAVRMVGLLPQDPLSAGWRMPTNLSPESGACTVQVCRTQTAAPVSVATAALNRQPVCGSPVL